MSDYVWKAMTGKWRDKLIGDVLGKPFIRPRHGSCCTCQTCGYSNESWDNPLEGDGCICGVSENLDAALWVAERWTFNWYVNRDVGWCGDGTPEQGRLETRETFAYHLILSYPGMPMWGVTGRTLAEAIWLAELKRRGVDVLGPLEMNW
jgi:hypothetical protein